MAAAPTLPNLPLSPNSLPPNGSAVIDDPNKADTYNLSQSGTYAPLVLNLGNDGNTANSKEMGDIINVTAPTLTGSAILGSNDILNLPSGWVTRGKPPAAGSTEPTVYTNADGTATFAVTGGHVNIGSSNPTTPNSSGPATDNPNSGPAITVQPDEPKPDHNPKING